MLSNVPVTEEDNEEYSQIREARRLLKLCKDVWFSRPFCDTVKMIISVGMRLDRSYINKTVPNVTLEEWLFCFRMPVRYRKSKEFALLKKRAKDFGKEFFTFSSKKKKLNSTEKKEELNSTEKKQLN